MNKEQLKKYFMIDLKWGWGYQQQIVFNFLCEAAKEAEGGIVLDAGAGHQRYKPFFEKSIYIAQEHPIAGQQNKDIQEFDILSDIKHCPLKDNSVDLILSTSSLEHMEYPDLFFSEAFRVIKPGGSLYINVPFAFPEHEIPYDFYRPTRFGLNRYYSHAGFNKISVLPTSSSIYTAQFFFRHALAEDGQRIRKKFWSKVARRIIFKIAAIVSKYAMRMFDKGPMSDTTLPVGWVAKGYKSGNKEAGKNINQKMSL